MRRVRLDSGKMSGLFFSMQTNWLLQVVDLIYYVHYILLKSYDALFKEQTEL